MEQGAHTRGPLRRDAALLSEHRLTVILERVVCLLLLFFTLCLLVLSKLHRICEAGIEVLVVVVGLGDVEAVQQLSQAHAH